VWWFGFDAAHGGDVMPIHAELFKGIPRTEYRGLVYMTAEVNDLAEQLAALASAP